MKAYPLKHRLEDVSTYRGSSSHRVQLAKAKANGTAAPTKSLEDFHRAFDIPEDYKEGAAFDKYVAL